MRRPSVLVALIVGASLVASSWILSAAIIQYGRSVERAAQLRTPSRSAAFPSVLTLKFESGNSPVRVQSSDSR